MKMKHAIVIWASGLGVAALLSALLTFSGNEPVASGGWVTRNAATCELVYMTSGVLVLAWFALTALLAVLWSVPWFVVIFALGVSERDALPTVPFPGPLQKRDPPYRPELKAEPPEIANWTPGKGTHDTPGRVVLATEKRGGFQRYVGTPVRLKVDVPSDRRGEWIQAGTVLQVLEVVGTMFFLGFPGDDKPATANPVHFEKLTK